MTTLIDLDFSKGPINFEEWPLGFLSDSSIGFIANNTNTNIANGTYNQQRKCQTIVCDPIRRNPHALNGPYTRIRYLQLSSPHEIPTSGKMVINLQASGSFSGISMASAEFRKFFPASVLSHTSSVKSGDFRLGSVGMCNIETLSHLVCDFLIADDGVYALYGRLPYNWYMENNKFYSSFVSMKRLCAHVPGQIHNLNIVIDREHGTICWTVDSKFSVQISKIGLKPHKTYNSGVYNTDFVNVLEMEPPAERLLLNLENNEYTDTVDPKVFVNGFGCFTFDDMVRPDDSKPQAINKLDHVPYRNQVPNVSYLFDSTKKSFGDRLEELPFSIKQKVTLEVFKFTVTVHQHFLEPLFVLNPLTWPVQIQRLLENNNNKKDNNKQSPGYDLNPGNVCFFSRAWGFSLEDFGVAASNLKQ